MANLSIQWWHIFWINNDWNIFHEWAFIVRGFWRVLGHPIRSIHSGRREMGMLPIERLNEFEAFDLMSGAVMLSWDGNNVHNTNCKYIGYNDRSVCSYPLSFLLRFVPINFLVPFLLDSLSLNCSEQNMTYVWGCWVNFQQEINGFKVQRFSWLYSNFCTERCLIPSTNWQFSPQEERRNLHLKMIFFSSPTFNIKTYGFHPSFEKFQNFGCYKTSTSSAKSRLFLSNPIISFII